MFATPLIQLLPAFVAGVVFCRFCVPLQVVLSTPLLVLSASVFVVTGLCYIILKRYSPSTVSDDNGCTPVSINVFSTIGRFFPFCTPMLQRLSIVIALFFAGMLHYLLGMLALERNAADLERLADTGGKHVVSAQIITAPFVQNDGLRFRAMAFMLHGPVSNSSVHGLFAVTVQGAVPGQFCVGDVVRFSGTFKNIRNFRTPGTFDYENWWSLYGIRVKAFVASPLLIVKTGHRDSGPSLSYVRFLLETGRARLMKFIVRCFPDAQQAAVADALLFGNRAGLSSHVKDAFSITGTGHLLAVSGLHMAMAAFLTYFCVRWLLLRWEWLALRIQVPKVATLLSMLPVIGYAGLSGFSPSANRAMIMILVFSAGMVLELPCTSMNSLAAAAWILLAISPFYLFDIGFQFSFVAVFFLILFSHAFRLPRDETSAGTRVMRYVSGLLKVSLVAALATGPLAAWYFQRISLIGPFLNVMLVPAVCFLILPCLVTGIVLLPVTVAGASLVYVPAGIMISCLLSVVGACAKIPFASMWIARPCLWQVALLLLALFVAGLSLLPGTLQSVRVRLRLMSFCLLAMVSAGMLSMHVAAVGRKDMVLHLLDVGQGTCQVVELPEGKVMVMDAGGMRTGTFDTGSRIVGPYLRTLGYTHIDILAFSHPETDHIGGLPSIVTQFRPDVLWTNGDTNNRNTAWISLAARLRQTGTRQVVFRDQAVIDRYGVSFHVFGSERCGAATDRNSRSLVIRLSCNGHSMLLTGDIDQARELCLFHQGLRASDVVVVPHHGSRTSSSTVFVRHVRARAALIPAGWRNYLHLPARDVVQRWERSGAVVLTTGEAGTLTAGFGRGRVVITTFSGHVVDAGKALCVGTTGGEV